MILYNHRHGVQHPTNCNIYKLSKQTTMKFKMYLAYDGNLMIHQVNESGKHLHFQVDFKRGYGTRESDLDDYEDESDYFKALKKSIANYFNLEQES